MKVLSGLGIIGEFKQFPNIEKSDDDNGDNIVIDEVFRTKRSVNAPYFALFNRFNLEAIPHFNFFTEDEETNSSQDVVGKQLSDISRYITLRWNKAPAITRDKSSQFSKRNKGPKNNTTFTGRDIKNNVKRFIDASDMLSNGLIAPGVINSIVEIQLEQSGIRDQANTHKVDEHKYLTSTEVGGISIHDLQTNINIGVNGIIGASRIKSFQTSDENDLFENNFSVSSQKQVTNSSLNIKSISAGNSIEMNIRTVDNSSMSEEETLLSDIKSNTSNLSNVRSSFTEVSFINPGIMSVVSESKVNSITAPEHAENVSGIAQFLPHLKMISEMNTDLGRRKTLSSIPALKSEEGIEYIGYIIEKYEQRKSGVFSLIDEIMISDRDIDFFVDTKVTYGTIYRYRIRAVLSWVRPGEFSVRSSTDISNYQRSFFHTEWNRRWQYSSVIDETPPSPPDEFRVLIQSNKKRVVISWKVPDNEQRDISYFKLLRREILENGNSTQWDVISVNFGAKNTLVIDDDVEFYQDSKKLYVYTAQTFSLHGEESLLSCQKGIKLNKAWSSNGEFEIKSISSQGVKISSIGGLSRLPIKRFSNELTFNDKFIVTTRVGTSKIPFFDKNYCIRITSLDTGEQRDIDLKLVVDNKKSNIIKSAPSPVTITEPIINDDWEYSNLFDGPLPTSD